MFFKILTGINTALLVIMLALGLATPAHPLKGVTGYDSLNLTPQSDDTYALAVNGVSLISTGGAIVQSLTGGLINVMPFLAVNTITQAASGFSNTFTTTTALTTTQFCATTHQRWFNTSAAATATLPAATSSYQACGSPAFGAWQTQFVTNDSTNTITYVAGTGMTFYCQTAGAGSSTVASGCTSSTVNVLASTSVMTSGFWDAASSTMHILWGPSYK